MIPNRDGHLPQDLTVDDLAAVQSTFIEQTAHKPSQIIDTGIHISRRPSPQQPGGGFKSPTVICPHPSRGQRIGDIRVADKTASPHAQRANQVVSDVFRVASIRHPFEDGAGERHGGVRILHS